jgi:predicted nucleic acid-binding protein
MILVDTSAWIDFFGGRDLPHVRLLETLLSDGEDVAICGVILSEILQGIGDDAQFNFTERRLDALLFLPMPRQTFLFAARIYRTLRKTGVTVRKPIDCMIAAVALENDAVLLHNDRDFRMIASHFPLRMLP